MALDEPVCVTMVRVWRHIIHQNGESHKRNWEWLWCVCSRHTGKLEGVTLRKTRRQSPPSPAPRPLSQLERSAEEGGVTRCHRGSPVGIQKAVPWWIRPCLWARSDISLLLKAKSKRQVNSKEIHYQESRCWRSNFILPLAGSSVIWKGYSSHLEYQVVVDWV